MTNEQPSYLKNARNAMDVRKEKALIALENLYRFFDVLDPDQRKERDQNIETIKKALE